MKYISTLILTLLSFATLAQPVEATLLANWQQDGLPSSSAHNNTYNEIWGHAINGQEYAIIGSTMGTHIIDVTTPSTPTEVQFIEGAATGTAIIHRDYHTIGDYLYIVCDEGQSTLQIVDLSGLPNAAPVLYDSNELLRTSHNIFIDEQTCRLYTLYARSTNGQFHAVRIYDISNPVEPTLINTYNSINGVSLTNGNGVHDAFIENNIAYLNNGTSGLMIVDFTDTDNPEILGQLGNYAQQGYNHSGWATPDGQYYYFADETHGTDLKVIDTDDFTDLEVLNLFDAGATDPNSIAHNLIVACDKLYVSYYYDGLQVYDISNPTNPVRIAYYDTYEGLTRARYEGAWGVYPFLPSGNVLLSDMQTGLYIFEGFDTNCRIDYDVNCLMVNTAETPSIVENISIFPQPTNQDLNIDITLEKTQQNVQFDLYDLTGRIIQRFEQKQLIAGENTVSFKINNTINTGMYLLKINSTDLTFSRKIVVNK